MSETYVESKNFDGLIFKGIKRFYIEDLSKRDFTLENTTPHEITLFGEKIEEHAWGNMLVDVVTILLKNIEKTTEELIVFRTDWTNNQIFTTEKKTNHKPIKYGLYLNCNHTAQHSCWLIQDILTFFGVDVSEVCFIIHRAPKAEPKDVKVFIKNEFQNHFIGYICNEKGKEKAEANEIVRIVNDELNKILLKITPSYNDFFLFDDYAYLYNYCKKVKDYIEPRMMINERQPLIDILDLLVEFYKTIKTSKKTK